LADAVPEVPAKRKGTTSPQAPQGVLIHPQWTALAQAGYEFAEQAEIKIVFHALHENNWPPGSLALCLATRDTVIKTLLPW